MARKNVSLAAVLSLSALFLAEDPRAASAQIGQWTSGSPEGWFNSVTVDPSDPWRLYAVAGAEAIYRSDDAGASWSRMRLMSDRSLAMAVSPSRLSALYAFDYDEATASYRVISSRDGGLRWSPTAFNSPDGANTLVVDPTIASTVYAGTERGLYKSTDSGASWENLKLREDTTRRIFQVLFPPRQPSTVYVVDADYSYYPESSVDKSTDGGRTWRTVVTGAVGTGPTALAIDPFDPSRLYAAGCPAFSRSTDAGETWTQAAAPHSNNCASSLVADPVRPGYLYTGFWGGGVWRSRDGGNTWQPFGEGILGYAVRLAIDPAGLFLHASTGRGVFDIQLGEIRPTTCEPGPERLCLLGGRFEVTVKIEDSEAPAVPQGDRFGSFRRQGAGPADPEIFVKMADGRARPNQAFWLFHSSLTDLPYTITVTDTATGRIRFYRNEPANPGCGAADTGAFVERPSATIQSPLAGPSLSPGDGETLPLLGGRYRVNLSVVNPFTGASDAALAMPQTDRLGYFSFPSVTGDPAFPEVFVSLSQLSFFEFRFSHTGLTNLRYTLTLTDRDTGSSAIYQNNSADVFNLCGGSSMWTDL